MQGLQHRLLWVVQLGYQFDGRQEEHTNHYALAVLFKTPNTRQTFSHSPVPGYQRS